MLHNSTNEEILELAILQIKPGMTADFERSFSIASDILQKAKGYRSHQLKRCYEDDHKYVLLVNWDSVEDHEKGFRHSSAYQEWKSLLHHYYHPFPKVEHYVCLS